MINHFWDVEFLHWIFQEEKDQISQFLTNNLDTYLEGMSRDGTYADHVCLQMLCKMLSVGMQIVHAETADIMVNPDNPKRLVLGYLPDMQHYVSLKVLER